MQLALAIVGRPNVGKSTLFNRLTRSRDALVADFPGLTRDRKYGVGLHETREYVVIDTGGLSGEHSGIDEYMAKQTLTAIDEADAILFVTDGQQGLTAADEQIAEQVRQTGKPVFLLINKTDGIDPEQAAADFYTLGFDPVLSIAASQNRGIRIMLDNVFEQFPQDEPESSLESEDDERIRIAFVGRPNVGKSTLINRILGEERVISFDQPGTTRDSIFIPFERDGKAYTLIDTAGVRRRSRVNETIEKFSIVKTLEAIRAASVVVMVVDAQDSIAEQDAHLLGLILDTGRALVLAINKWDGLKTEEREHIHKQLEIKLSFIPFARRHFISALHGTGVGNLYQSVHEAHQSAMMKVPTSRLTRILETALETHQPPLVQGRRIKLRFAHQGGSNPFVIVIHGNQTDKLPVSYQRYLINYFQKTLNIRGSQVKLEFRTTNNPYEGKRNKLTPRQQYKKKRLMKFVKKKS